MGLVKIPQTSIEYFKSNLDDIFESGNLAEGPWNEKLSEFTKEKCFAACAIPTVSNGSGMVALLQIYKENDNRTKVLLQSNTMYGVKTMVNSAGLEIDGYIDCDLNTLMPAADDVATALDGIGDKSSLIVLLSHIGGIINPNIVEIAELCKKNNVILLEDCAHSFGAVYKNRHSGTFGDGGVYSFYATKAIPAGEGGIVVTNNEEIGAVLHDYIRYDRFKQVMNIGVNIRPSEVQALMIYSVMKEVDQIIENKTRIAEKYMEACNELAVPYISQDRDGHKGNYYKFTLTAGNDDIAGKLPKLKTVTSRVYDYCLGNTEVITKNHFCLPIWYDQPSEITERVVEELYDSVNSL